mgnify:CR=1 FL=1
MVKITKDLISKSVIVDNDQFSISDSADLYDAWDTESGKLKRLSWVNLKTSITSYYDALATTITNKTIDLSSNTITTTKAQLDTAVSDGDVVYTNDTSVLSNSWVLDEDDMVSDSNTKVPTQQSTKAYVDANVWLDITWLTEESAIVSWDFFPFYDVSAWANMKVDLDDITQFVWDNIPQPDIIYWTDYISAEANTERSYASPFNTWTQSKSITISEIWTYNISFEWQQWGNHSSQARIYKNGVGIWTAVLLNDGSYQTHTSSSSFNEWDTCELWYYCNNGVWLNLKNFKMEFSLDFWPLYAGTSIID